MPDNPYQSPEAELLEKIDEGEPMLDEPGVRLALTTLVATLVFIWAVGLILTLLK